MNRNNNKKYNIKSSLFLDKGESTKDLEASRYSRNDISTNLSEIKRNDYSYFSKIYDNDKSGIFIFFILLGLIEINKTQTNLKYDYSLNNNKDKFNYIEAEISTDLESSEKSVFCVCSRSSCFSF